MFDIIGASGGETPGKAIVMEDEMPQNNSKRISQKGFVKRLKLKATAEEIMLHGALLHAFLPYRVVVCFQEPIGPYIADFFLYPFNLVIEVDGLIHSRQENQEHDRRRNTYMKNKAITVLRLTNSEVRANPARVARTIVAFCAKTYGEIPKQCDPIDMKRFPAWNRELCGDLRERS